mgnify:FL=1
MKVVIKYKKSRNKLLGAIAAIPICLGVGIAAFSFSTEDDESFQLRSLVERASYQQNSLNMSLSISSLWNGLNSGQDQWTNSSANTTNESTIANTATNGTGLNLLLINNIGTECFVKEYLSICAENQNGELDTTARTSTVGVQAIIGINISESEFYSAGDGKTLPCTDLPAGNDGAPMWDNDTYSLKKWSNTQHSVIGGASAVGGPFQYTPGGGALTAIATKSKYNSGTSTGGGIGDCYLFPDAVSGLNGYLETGEATLNVTSLTVEESAIVTAIAHNRGGGGTKMLYGIPYDTIQNRRASDNFYNKSAVTESEVKSILDDYYNAFAEIPNGIDAVSTMSAGGYIMESFPLIAKGWYFSTTGGASAKARYSDTIKAAWNAYLPNEQISNAAEFNAAIDRHTSKLSVALGMSEPECDAVYGTQNGDYTRYFRNSPGDVFRVYDTESNVYKAGSHKLVTSLEMITVNHVYSLVTAASQVYAKMLKYAGVDVDPTDPSTYMSTYSKNGEWVPTGDNVDVGQELIANGFDTSNTTAERTKVLLAAAKLTGITYKQCRHFAGCDGFCYDVAGNRPTHLDCSTFVWRAFYDVGFDMSQFPTNTKSYKSSSVVREINYDEVKPGDILIKKDTHAELLMGKNGSTYSFIEAFRPGKPSGYIKKDISAISGPNYKFYRFTGFSD